MALKRIFSKDHIIILFLFISLGINIYLLYGTHQLREGLIAQLEMIDSAINSISDIENKPNDKSPRDELYMMFFKGISDDINSINSKLNLIQHQEKYSYTPSSSNFWKELEQDDRLKTIEKQNAELKQKIQDKEINDRIYKGF